MKLRKTIYPVSYNRWVAGKNGFEVRDQFSNRICSYTTEAASERIALCINYCAEMSNEDLLKDAGINPEEVKP